MINKYFGGQVPTFVANVTDFDADLAAVVAENLASYHKYMEAVDYPRFGSCLEYHLSYQQVHR